MEIKNKTEMEIKMTNDERKDLLREAQRTITQAMEDIREATNNDSFTENYLCAPLSIIVGEGRYHSPEDLTIEQTIDRLDEMNLKDDETESDQP